MFKLILLFFLFAYEAKCESEFSVTTVLPHYSVNQVEEDVQAAEGKSAADEIQIEPVHFAAKALNEVKQVYIDDLSQQMNVEVATNAPEVTTILPTVQRVKRAPQYTVREILYPNGIMHEVSKEVTIGHSDHLIEPIELTKLFHFQVGHLRDHAVNRVAKGVNRRLPNPITNRLEDQSSRRVVIHHKYHHIPNHLSYLPVVGPFLGN